MITNTQQTLFDSETGKSAKQLLPAVLSEHDLKEGFVMTAKWDGANSRITKIENGIVHYKCLIYGGDYKDSIQTIIECFEHDRNGR